VLDIGASNLDLVHSIYADWERGDFRRVEWADPQIEYVNADGPEPGSWSGLAGLAEGIRALLEAWEGFHLEVEKYRELDGGRVLVFVRAFARGKTSGLEVENLNANVLDISDGKVTRLVNYNDRDRAFADLGLTPEDEAL
jgi:ketosteroid isomerase-like protein